MKLIQTVTVGTASSIVLSSIPQDFTDLVVLMSVRNAGANNQFGIKINTSSANFTGRFLRGTGTGTESTTVNNELGFTSGAAHTSNTFGNASIYIPNYTGSANKTISTDSVSENNGTEGLSTISANLWSQTAAITQIELYALVGNNFEPNSTISLYGILKGSDGITTAS
jgi:hypothetical protein